MRTLHLSRSSSPGYLSANDRWNSPKYIYGESYGTLAECRPGRLPGREGLHGHQWRHPAIDGSDPPDEPVLGEQRRSIRGVPAHVCGHCVVPPPAARSAVGAAALPAAGGAICAQRLCRGAERRQFAEYRPVRCHRGEAARVHRPQHRIHRKGESARHGSGVLQAIARRPERDRRPPGLPLRGPEHRSVERRRAL